MTQRIAGGTVLLLLLTTADLGADEAEDKASQAIEKLGGRITRNEQADGKPVFRLRETTPRPRRGGRNRSPCVHPVGEPEAAEHSSQPPAIPLLLWPAHHNRIQQGWHLDKFGSQETDIEMLQTQIKKLDETATQHEKEYRGYLSNLSAE
jgi:hypothetical protein